MASSKKPSLFISLLLLLLLVSAAHGAQPEDTRETTVAAAGDGREQVTVRTTGHGHGYSSHSGGQGHTSSGGTSEHGGAGVVDPRNLNARSHRSGAVSSRVALGRSSVVACGLVGAILAVVVLP